MATAAAPSSSVAARVPKELPAGYWQAQIQKYEAVTIAGEPRQFPQRVIIGAETIIARLAHEVKTETRYFNAAGEPNPLCSAKKKAKAGTTILTVNEDNQLEAEPEIPWEPKSVLAFLDCLEAIKHAWLLVEFAPEKSVSAFLEWFGRVVRARPLKLEQLRVFWEATSWRLALGLRARVSFADMTSEITGTRKLSRTP